MTENGQPMATRKEPVATGFGENTLAWLPGNYVDGMRWSMPSADTLYQVTVANVLVDGRARSFSYAVTVFDPQSAATTPALTPDGELSVKGSFRYQACDDKVCYTPRTIPLEWRIRVNPPDRQRVPAPLRGKLR